jgi:tetratricopeptide (TPR) repeat protein
VEAVLGLAVIEERCTNIQNYIHYLKNAAKIDREHPLVLLHLAEHYLFAKNLDKCAKLAEEGLRIVRRMPKINRSSGKEDYYEFEGRFLNLLGQAKHAAERYEEALAYYAQVPKVDTPCAIFNAIQVAQCQAATGHCPLALQTLQNLHDEQQLHERQEKNPRAYWHIPSTFELMILLKEKTAYWGNFRAFVNDFRAAIDYKPTHYNLRWRLLEHFILRRNEEGIEQESRTFFRLEQEVPMKAEDYINIAVIRTELRDYSAAQIYLGQALERIGAVTS